MVFSRQWEDFPFFLPKLGRFKVTISYEKSHLHVFSRSNTFNGRQCKPGSTFRVFFSFVSKHLKRVIMPKIIQISFGCDGTINCNLCLCMVRFQLNFQEISVWRFDFRYEKQTPPTFLVFVIVGGLTEAYSITVGIFAVFGECQHLIVDNTMFWIWFLSWLRRSLIGNLDGWRFNYEPPHSEYYSIYCHLIFMATGGALGFMVRLVVRSISSSPSRLIFEKVYTKKGL